MKILVTGAAGFIGMHFARKVLLEKHEVLGIDDINPYYEPGLKRARLDQLAALDGFQFEQIDIAHTETFSASVFKFEPDVIVHLAAQAGIRYSIENPELYVQSNLVGFANVLELSRVLQIKHFIYASSSSIYGARSSTPFRVTDVTDSPISFYAATKKSNEAMAHSYSHLFNIPTTGLRFFTIYGPWGRPDMAYYLFTKHILEQTTFKLFNGGELSRDFTYIDDIVELMYRLIDSSPQSNVDGQVAPYRLLNIGRGEPVHIGSFVNTLEMLLGKPALFESVGMQPGDMTTTFADTGDLVGITGYTPQISIDEGLKLFVEWYKEYYDIT